LCRLGQGSDDETDDQHAVIHDTDLRSGQRRPFKPAEPGGRQAEGEQESGIAAAIGDERKQGVAGRHRPMPGIADEQEGRDTAHLPANKGKQPVTGKQHELDAGQEKTDGHENRWKPASRCR
jgi:hypothetical protein